MLIRSWERLPAELQQAEIKDYHSLLQKKNVALCCKRVFDLLASLVLLILLAPLILILILAIKLDSRGPVFYRQIRVTQYARRFAIVKFRTMVPDADRLGTQVTVDRDPRITRIGRFLRRYRLDELPQLFNILGGSMTFVGTRPEVPKYVAQYTDEMLATLLLPAGVTSLASIRFKDEQSMLDRSQDVDRTYVEEVLPLKMAYNLEYLRCFSLWEDFRLMFKTVKEVFL